MADIASLAAIALLACAALAGCGAADPLPSIVVSIKPPAAPSPALGRARVHIHAPDPLVLREQLSDGWSTACTAPCDLTVRTGRVYRLFLGDDFASDTFSLDAPEGAVVTIEAPPIPRGRSRFQAPLPMF